MSRQRSIPFIAIMMFLCATFALSQAVSLQEQLSAQYQLAKVRAEPGGYAVNTPGTRLTIQQKGVLGVPWKALALCPAKHQDNNGGILRRNVEGCLALFPGRGQGVSRQG